MPRIPLRLSPLLAPVIVSFLALGALLEQDGRGQVGSPAGAIQKKPTPFLYSSEDCVNCHNNDVVKSYRPESLKIAICRMNEWQSYHKKDRHRIAYDVLKADRSRQMVRGLGLKDADATTVAACLNCHALPAAGDARASQRQLADGVTCVACHGPFAEWVEIHPRGLRLREQAASNPRPGVNREKNWLDFDRQTKETVYGMTDLWDPVKRAEVCASCHIGNLRDGKVVTHAMYAAGHPPLPGFEAATFSDAQPRHWQYLNEKTAAQKKRLQPFPEGHLEQTELVAVSGLVALREVMELTEAQARANLDQPVGAAWPDYARFDCRSCHHELRTSGFVSRDLISGRSRRLGRPGVPTWPHALVRIGIKTLVAASDRQKEIDRYEKLVGALEDAMTTRPFGDKEATIKAAAELAAWANRLLTGRLRPPIGPDRARELLMGVCDLATEDGLDYDRARQSAWAFRAIYHELTLKSPRDPQIEASLKKLTPLLGLDLPTAGDQIPIEKSLGKWLGVMADYDPHQVQALFRQLREQVAGR